MIKELSQLEGMRLESFRVARGSYAFEFDGSLFGEHCSLEISTPHCLAAASQSTEDLREKTSQHVWPLLEQHVVSITVSTTDIRDEIIFEFQSGKLVLWADRPSPSELLIVRNRLGDEWSAFL